MKINIHFTLAILLFFVTSCSQPKEKISGNKLLHHAMESLTDVIVYDIFSPPVASRIYAYTSISAYEVLCQSNADFFSMKNQLKGFKGIPQQREGVNLNLAAIHAFLEVGKTMIFSEDRLIKSTKDIYSYYKTSISDSEYKSSIDYGNKVSEAILSWASKDFYKQTRTMQNYNISDDTDKWQPTPPDYMDGIEPNWMKIRPFVIDSANQFIPAPPTPFSLDENSTFYKELMETYHALDPNFDDLSVDERIKIAEFWDCNPFVSHHEGHLMYGTKKITPGGHWIGIAQLVSKKSADNILQAAQAYAWTSIALADAFISCWDEKYRSVVVRPETVINASIDKDWKPALQTPPFPEYTSGHSVISRAAAVILTHIYGDNFKFDDSVEVKYGLPVRSFNSFYHASEEAAISRLYGGIHYRPACENGVKQGEKLGIFITKNLKTN